MTGGEWAGRWGREECWAGGTGGWLAEARGRGAHTSHHAHERTIRRTGEHESASLQDKHGSAEGCEICGSGRRAASRQQVANGGATSDHADMSERQCRQAQACLGWCASRSQYPDEKQSGGRRESRDGVGRRMRGSYGYSVSRNTRKPSRE